MILICPTCGLEIKDDTESKCIGGSECQVPSKRSKKEILKLFEFFLLSSLFTLILTSKIVNAADIDCVTQKWIPSLECQSLVDLHDNISGLGQQDNDGWKTDTSPCTWTGVTCSGGVVTGINIVKYDDNITGSIPSSIANLVNLTDLELMYGLFGSIPVEIGNLVNLRLLNLAGNNLSGSIPSSIGNLDKLSYLNLSNNQLDSSIPFEISDLSSLTYLNLGYNQISGTIPSGIDSLVNLIEMTLYNNQINGSIPSSVGSLISLQRLYLADNHLSGPIPTTLGNLTNLTALYLTGNQLSGSIPSSIGNLKKLTFLNLANNKLSGTVPLTVAQVGATTTSPESCSFAGNAKTLCIPNTPEYQAIGQNPICQLPLSNSCVDNSKMCVGAFMLLLKN